MSKNKMSRSSHVKTINATNNAAIRINANITKGKRVVVSIAITIAT